MRASSVWADKMDDCQSQLTGPGKEVIGGRRQAAGQRPGDGTEPHLAKLASWPSASSASISESIRA